MNLLSIPLPRCARVVFNSLYDSRESILLTQDVLLVSLPNDVFIDVGWYPEHDPQGAYRIGAYRGDWQNQLLAEPIRTQDARKVVEEVRRLGDTFSTETRENVTWEKVPFYNQKVVTTSGSEKWREVSVLSF